jgi:protein phosphatase/serine/threonine-protein phosphatase Stp1
MICEALEAIPAGLPAAELLAQVRQSISAVHEALRQMAHERGPAVQMASTVVVLLARGGHYACLWAGDSRAYLLRDGALMQVTRDHSMVQELLDSGAITEQEAAGHPRRNVITRAVGVDLDDLALDKESGRVEPGDRFLLCSDGLCNTLSAETLQAGLMTDDGEGAAETLIAQALTMNATDNISAVVVEVVG